MNVFVVHGCMSVLEADKGFTFSVCLLIQFASGFFTNLFSSQVGLAAASSHSVVDTNTYNADDKCIFI